MTYSSSEHSDDEPGVNLERQARTAWDTYRQELRRLTERGESPRKLSPRHVRIPHWTVAAARQFQTDPGSTAVVVEKTTGGHMAAAVLSQLIFWLTGRREDGSPRAHAPIPDRGLDHPWTATTAAELARQIGARRKQVEPCLALLRSNGWIVSDTKKCHVPCSLRWKTVSHVWLGPQTFDILSQIGAMGGNLPAMWLAPWAMLATGGDISAALLLTHVWYLAFGREEADGWVVEELGADGGPKKDAIRLINEDLAERLLLSKDQVKRAKAMLVDRGLITTPGRSLVQVNAELCTAFAVLSVRRNTEMNKRSS